MFYDKSIINQPLKETTPRTNYVMIKKIIVFIIDNADLVLQMTETGYHGVVVKYNDWSPLHMNN